MFEALLGVYINVALIILGGTLGIIFKKGIPEKYSQAIMNASGLTVVFIGISGTLKTSVSSSGEIISANSIIMICSMVIGTIIGTLIDIDGKLNRLGARLEKKFAKGEENSTFAQGFVNATLLYCIGAMAITGPIESAIEGNHSILIAKGIIDGVTSVIFASTFGIGVLFSVFPIFLYEGAIGLIAYFAGQAFLTDAMNIQLICVGSLVILSIGLNMLKITKIKIADMLPAIIIAPVMQWIISLFQA